MKPQAGILTIGALARRAGVRTSRIRYYERIGLLPPAVRSGGDQRVYTGADLARVVFVRRCRDFGFSVEEVRELVSLSARPGQDCADVGAIARARRDAVRGKLAELQNLEASLSAFVADCESVCCGRRNSECVIFEKIGAV